MKPVKVTGREELGGPRFEVCYLTPGGYVQLGFFARSETLNAYIADAMTAHYMACGKACPIR